MGIAISAVQTLRKAGHDIRHLSEDGLERLSDSRILEKAGREGSIVITR
jgi:predicted nuclease of predicted toxin-antitoxin system